MKINVLKKEVFANIKKSVYKRIFFFMVLFGIIQLLLYLDDHETIFLPLNIIKFFDIVIFSILVIILMNIVLRFTVSKVFHFQEAETEIEQRIFITKIYTFFLYFLALSAILWKVGVSITNIALVMGIAATGIAFAIREVLLAFFVWLVILTKNPFRINDVIQVGDDIGLVSRIGTFYVTLDTGKGSNPFIKIPNKIFFDRSIFNMGKKIYHSVNIPLKNIPKGFGKKIKDIKKYLDSNSNDARVDIYYENLVPALKISFALPFREDEKKNEIIIFLNEKLKKEIKNK